MGGFGFGSCDTFPGSLPAVTFYAGSCFGTMPLLLNTARAARPCRYCLCRSVLLSTALVGFTQHTWQTLHAPGLWLALLTRVFLHCCAVLPALILVYMPVYRAVLPTFIATVTATYITCQFAAYRWFGKR